MSTFLGVVGLKTLVAYECDTDRLEDLLAQVVSELHHLRVVVPRVEDCANAQEDGLLHAQKRPESAHAGHTKAGGSVEAKYAHNHFRDQSWVAVGRLREERRRERGVRVSGEVVRTSSRIITSPLTPLSDCAHASGGRLSYRRGRTAARSGGPARVQ